MCSADSESVSSSYKTKLDKNFKIDQAWKVRLRLGFEVIRGHVPTFVVMKPTQCDVKMIKDSKNIWFAYGILETIRVSRAEPWANLKKTVLLLSTAEKYIYKKVVPI